MKRDRGEGENISPRFSLSSPVSLLKYLHYKLQNFVLIMARRPLLGWEDTTNNLARTCSPIPLFVYKQTKKKNWSLFWAAVTLNQSSVIKFPPEDVRSPFIVIFHAHTSFLIRSLN